MYATGNQRYGGTAQDDTLHGRRILSNTLRQGFGKMLTGTRLAEYVIQTLFKICSPFLRTLFIHMINDLLASHHRSPQSPPSPL